MIEENDVEPNGQKWTLILSFIPSSMNILSEKQINRLFDVL